MKLHCLGLSPLSSCYLLEYNNFKILLDCGIEITSLLNYLPPTTTSFDQNNNNNNNSSSSGGKKEIPKCFKEINGNIYINQQYNSNNNNNPEQSTSSSSSFKYNCLNGENLIGDFESIDIILISNYMNIHALPFITEYSKFRGKIFATEPTVQIGKLLLDELIQMDTKQQRSWLKEFNSNSNLKTSPLPSSSSSSSSSPSVAAAVAAAYQSFEAIEQLNNNNNLLNPQNSNISEIKTSYQWKELYKRIDIEKSFEKIQPVRFNEILKFQTGAFNLIPVSSGFTLGSCNWIIENSQKEKVIYLSDSSLALSRYPLPMEIESLCTTSINNNNNSGGSTSNNNNNNNILICTKLNHHSNFAPDEKLNELCSLIGQTIQQNQGTVIIPCYSCGIVLDLFEHFSEYLSKLGLQYHQVPMYFISPVSKEILSYADLYSEWLNKSKQERSFMPDTPFLHQDMIRKGQFQLIHQVHSNFQPPPFDSPSIQFVGHPSCRMGDVLSLFQKYAENPKNSIFFIEPEFDFKKLISPFQKIQCRVNFLPIDPRINFNDANLLIAKLSPKHLIIPEPYKNYLKNHHLNGNEGIVSTISSLDILKISDNHQFSQQQSQQYQHQYLHQQQTNRQTFDIGYLDKSIAKNIKVKSTIAAASAEMKKNENNNNNNRTESISDSDAISFRESLINIAEISGFISLRDNQNLIISPPPPQKQQQQQQQQQQEFHKSNFIYSNSYLSVPSLIRLISNATTSTNPQVAEFKSIEVIEELDDKVIIKIYENDNNNNNDTIPTLLYITSTSIRIETKKDSIRKLLTDIVLSNCIHNLDL